MSPVLCYGMSLVAPSPPASICMSSLKLLHRWQIDAIFVAFFLDGNFISKAWKNPVLGLTSALASAVEEPQGKTRCELCSEVARIQVVTLVLPKAQGFVKTWNVYILAIAVLH